MKSHIPIAANCTYPLRAGNRITPLIDGLVAFRRICEAVEAATSSVWITVAFLEKDFVMPDGRGSFFDVIESASQRGLDVKVIFWRSPEQESAEPNCHFHGQKYQRDLLEAADYTFSALWDYLPRGKCHHQKSWLVDGGTEHEIAFVGGINLGVNDVVEVGHTALETGSTHDIYCELAGPCTTDVQHNFVQRWNEASERNSTDGSWPANAQHALLAFPTALSATRGDVSMQLSRTIRRDQYFDGTAAVGANPFDIQTGEKSAFEQYLLAIQHAKHSIYIEDQAIASSEAMTHLEAALARGVQVVFLVPGCANDAYVAARQRNPELPMFTALDRLAEYKNFTLAAICSRFDEGGYCEIYVHSKVAIVDDHWATIGSCNFADRSFHSDTELNATFWDEATARQLRVDLFREHLGVDTSAQAAADALQLFSQVAEDNLDKKSAGETLSGLAYALDAKAYGL